MSKQNVVSTGTKIDGSLGTNLTTISEIYLNTSVEIIIICVDKVKLCLKDHLSRLEKKHSWMTPFAICITIFLTIATAEFKPKAFWLSGHTWTAVFLIVGVFSLAWLVIAIVAACRVESIDDVVGELKKEAKILPVDRPSEVPFTSIITE